MKVNFTSGLRHYIAPRFTFNTIKRMKRLLLGVLAACCSTLAYSQATEVVVETFAEDIGMMGDVDLTGYNTYRVYVKFASDQDYLTAVYGDADFPTRIKGGNNFFNAVLGGKDNSQYNPLLFAVYPDLVYDSFVTVGMTAPADADNGESPIYTIGDPDADWVPLFEPGAGATGSDIIIETQTGGSWFPLFPDNNGYAGEDSLILIGQFTTDTTLFGVISIASFVGGDQDSTALGTFPFSSIPDAVFGCTDMNAENFDMNANEDNGSCVYDCTYPGTMLMVTATNVSDLSCSGAPDGVVSVSVSGGQGGLSYSNGMTTNATGIFSDANAGDMTITVTDSQGCQAEATVTVGAPEPLEVTAILADPISCTGLSDAVLSGGHTGGTGAVTYSLTAPMDTGTGPYFEMSSETLLFENMGIGLYTVYGIDENGCLDNTTPITISQPQPFNLYAQAVVPTTCPDSNDGAVVLNFFGGSGNSTTYSTDGTNYDANNTYDLGPGTYTFYAQDVNGCSDTLTDVEVVTPAEFVSQVDLVSPSCFGDTDGEVTVEVQGGTGSISYVYEGETLDMFSLNMVGAGAYSLEVVDGNGCTYDASVELTGPSEIVPTATVTDVLCNGEENGAIALTVAGGTGMGYTYSIDSGVFGPSADFDGLSAGDYLITVQDDSECSGSATVTVSAPEAIAITVDANDGASGTEADGVIDITVTGGTPPYDFSWTGPNYTGEDEDVSGVVAGDYTVTITDGNDCEFTSTTIVVVSGIEEVVSLIDVSLFPNPTNSNVTMSLSGLAGQAVSTVLIDGLGREVAREDLGNLAGQFMHTMDLSSVESGVYYLRVNVASASEVLRIVKH